MLDSMKKRYKPDERRTQVLAAALQLAQQKHYLSLTRNEIAAAVGLSGPAVQYHFGTMDHLIEELIAYAIDEKDLTVLAQAVSAKHPLCSAVPSKLRRKATRESYNARTP